MQHGHSASGLNFAIGVTGFPVIFAGLVHLLPAGISVLAGVLGIVWYALQIYESKAVQSWKERKRNAKSSSPPDSP